jgi:hypothetical protein
MRVELEFMREPKERPDSALFLAIAGWVLFALALYPTDRTFCVVLCQVRLEVGW